MQNDITIHEYRSPMWTYLVRVLLLLALLFFGAYLLIENTLWTGILRLAAFASFAGLVVVWLKVRHMPKRITLSLTSDHLVVHYFEKTKEIKEELFERDTIKRIQKKEARSIADFLSQTTAFTFIISFSDTDNELSLFIYSGQHIKIAEPDAQVLESFLTQHNIEYTG